MKTWPQQDEAKALGCTCTWFGSGTIVDFNDDCPILELHRPRAAHLPDEVSTIDALQDWQPDQIELVRQELDRLFGTAGGCHDEDDAKNVIKAVLEAHPLWFAPRIAFSPPSL